MSAVRAQAYLRHYGRLHAWPRLLECADVIEELEKERKKLESRLTTVRGAIERGNLTQARIWLGLPTDSSGASVVPEQPDVQTPYDAEWLET